MLCLTSNANKEPFFNSVPERRFLISRNWKQPLLSVGVLNDYKQGEELGESFRAGPQ